jgi:hypothetical protein
MNIIIKDGEGFFKFIIYYGVCISEAQRLGMVIVGLDLK